MTRAEAVVFCYVFNNHLWGNKRPDSLFSNALPSGPISSYQGDINQHAKSWKRNSDNVLKFCFGKHFIVFTNTYNLSLPKSHHYWASNFTFSFFFFHSTEHYWRNKKLIWLSASSSNFKWIPPLLFSTILLTSKRSSVVHSINCLKSLLIKSRFQSHIQHQWFWMVTLLLKWNEMKW